MQILFTFLIFLINFQNQNVFDSGQNLYVSVDGGFDTYEIPSEFQTFVFNPFQSENENLLLSDSSGIVLRVVSDSIYRIDRSYDDRIHNKSLDFIYNDTLFRFGGYGYFNSTKNLIFFDKNSRSWDLVKYNGHEDLPIFSKIGYHFIRDDILTVIGMNFNSEDLHLTERVRKLGFKFDLKSKSVISIFGLNESFEPPQSYVQVNRDYVFLFNSNSRVNRELRILNTENLKEYTYLLDQESSLIVPTHYNNFLIDENSLLYPIEDIFRKIRIHSISIDEVIHNMKETEGLIKQDRSTLWYIPIIFSVVFLIFFFKTRKKSLRFLLNYSQISKGNKIFKIDPLTYEILREIHVKKSLTTDEMNSFFDSDSLNRGHVNRKKNEFVGNLNMKFNLIFGIDLLTRFQSKYDKRIINYSLNPEIELLLENE